MQAKVDLGRGQVGRNVQFLSATPITPLSRVIDGGCLDDLAVLGLAFRF